jgi:hypothetical protein
MWACKDTASIAHVDDKLLLTPDEAHAWHLKKDTGGPTYSGSPSWVEYMTFIESKLRQYGAKDISRRAGLQVESSFSTLLLSGSPVCIRFRFLSPMMRRHFSWIGCPVPK